MAFLFGIGIRLVSLVGVALLASVAACAAGPRLVDHSFGFDARWDSPDVEILDYRYGTSNFPGVRACPKEYSHCDKVPQGAGTSGEMLLGDDLYVKWRIKSTGEIYEDTVDLRNRLPEDMHRQRIRFVVWGPQLYVYLISPKRKDGCPDDYSDGALACIRQATARNGGAAVGCAQKNQQCRITDPACPSAQDRILAMYCHLKFVQIYPSQSEFQQSSPEWRIAA